MLRLCAAEGIGVTPWSPLARGLLTRDWDENTYRVETDNTMKRLYGGTQDADRRVIQAVGEVAAGRGVPRAQVALAWLLQRPVVTAPIVGASKPQHLVDAVSALELKLSPDEMHRLEEAYVPLRATIGSFDLAARGGRRQHGAAGGSTGRHAAALGSPRRPSAAGRGMRGA
jgi:aryl-alcohol dehydrogenase-like predicted oxidoreductase